MASARRFAITSLAWALSCAAPPPGPPAPRDAGLPPSADAGVDAGVDAGEAPRLSAGFSVAQYPDGSGPLLRMPISVNGSPPIQVLVDTGADGLRLFPGALQGTAVDETAQAISAEFGYGERMEGKLARGTVTVGEAGTAGPIAFHRVERFTCAAHNPGCAFAGGTAPFFEEAGVQGILGVSTRRGEVGALYSPFAQLQGRAREGFTVRTGGAASAGGTVLFGREAADAGFAMLALPPDGLQPNGVRAFRDGSLTACFAVNGVDVPPRCTEAVFDTGASMDIFHAPQLPAGTVVDGALAPGATLKVSLPGAWEESVTVGTVPQPGKDLFLVDEQAPFALLGVGWFFRYDVAVDAVDGKLGFRRAR
ncbi:MAG: hypothetical protein FJ086_04845 [Deltaproteobacteria bacterium]|nr:hypothetical protein [Deltaproteobacteria bacterium]